MATMMSRNWWAVLVRGAIALLFGILILLIPNITLSTFILLFTVYALISGALATASSIEFHDQHLWWVHLLEGLMFLLAGAFSLVFRGMTAVTMLYVVAVWAIISGLFEIWASAELRREVKEEYWLLLSGIISLVLGVLLFLFPGAGVLSAVGLISAYGIAFGLVTVILSFRLQNETEEKQQTKRTA